MEVVALLMILCVLFCFRIKSVLVLLCFKWVSLFLRSLFKITVDSLGANGYIVRQFDAGWSSLVARRAHNPKVVGSNPAPATIEFTGGPVEGFFITCRSLK